MWLMGYLGNASWNQIVFLIIPLIFSKCIFLCKKKWTWYTDVRWWTSTFIRNRYAKLKFHLLIVSSFVVAYSVAFTGMIGFVGLIVPHIMRNIIGTLK